VLTARNGAGAAASDPQGIENDGCSGTGCTSAFNTTPFTVPVVANFTLVGTGANATSGSSGGVGIMLRRGTGGYYVNGVVARWSRAGVSVRDVETYARAGSAATPDMATADLAVRNVAFVETPTMFQTGGSSVQNSFDATGNALIASTTTITNTFTAFPAAVDDNTTEAAFDWTPPAGSVAASGGMTTYDGKLAARTTTPLASGAVVAGTSFMGAAASDGTKWWQGWTRYSRK
jgi:hypothetical protein